MSVPLRQLYALWRELESITVTEEEETLLISDAFIDFPASTPVLDIRDRFETSHSAFVVARMLYD